MTLSDEETDKRIIIIGGPNGAGKTTFALTFLPVDKCLNFVNADLIAIGLSPFDPDAAAIRAGRLMLEEIDGYLEREESFAFETTLSGRAYARRIQDWRDVGYRVELIFLKLEHVETAIDRVAARVAQGGHSIPEQVIRRRFIGGLLNFERLYQPIVDVWSIYDNSGDKPRLIEIGQNT